MELAGVKRYQLRSHGFGRGEKHFVVGMAVRVPINGCGRVARARVAMKNDNAMRFEVAFDFRAEGIEI
jgi:hypothetical protein